MIAPVAVIDTRVDLAVNDPIELCAGRVLFPGSGWRSRSPRPPRPPPEPCGAGSQLSMYFRNKSSPRPIISPTNPRARTHGLERLSCMYRSLDRLPDPWRSLPSVLRSRRPQLSLAAEGEGGFHGGGGGFHGGFGGYCGYPYGYPSSDYCLSY